MTSSTFQYILLIIFGFLGIFGILIFAGIIPIGGEGALYEGEVTVWGFVPDRYMVPIVADFNKENGNTLTIKYSYKDKNTFEGELVNALARGEGPDIVMFPNDLIVMQGDKLAVVPYINYSERTFKENFVEAGEIFLNKDGVMALPVYADPMVMYWNRDLFANAGLVTYPKNWVEFLNLSSKLTQKDNKGNIFQSAVAMGSYKNISNSKDILATLFLQVGDSIVSRNPNIGGGDLKLFEPVLGSLSGATESALNFFVEFSNPAKSAYSWNPSLSNSKLMFGEGKLAVYFGKASEYKEIKDNNPHLNFDVAVIPQRDDSAKRITQADVVGLAVVRTSRKLSTSTKALYLLTNKENSKRITSSIYLPSLRRDILSEKEPDPVLSIFNDSAVISKTWYDPDASGSAGIFKGLIESVNSGRQSAGAAIKDAQVKFLEYVK